MNTINFSFPGGFPLTQDELDYLQQSYLGAIQALGTIIGKGPVALTGCVYSASGTVQSVTSGYIWYNGQMLYVPAASVDTSVPGTAPGFLVTQQTTNLTYNDGSVRAAHVAVMALWTNINPMYLSLDAQTFAYSDLVSAAVSMGKERVFTNVAVPAGSFSTSGTVKVKKNFLINCVQIEVNVTIGNPSALADGPDGSVVGIGVLSSAYWPATAKGYMLPLKANMVTIVAQDAGGFLNAALLQIDTAGNMKLILAKPVTGLTTMNINGSVLMALD